MSKVAVVTGSGHGIGKEVAIELGRLGYDVCVTYSSTPEKAEETAAEIRKLGQKAITYQVNLENVDQIDPMFDEVADKLGAIEVLVNNAGLTKYMPFLEATPEHFNQIMSIDLRGAYFCAQRAAKDMIKNNIRGCIINISSNHRATCFPKDSVYGAAKAAVCKVTQNMALELAPYNIRVNCISPGYIKVSDPNVVTEREAMMVSRIPMQHIGHTPNIAKTVKFLISEDAEYITGTDILVDGGSLLPALMDNTFIK